MEFKTYVVCLSSSVINREPKPTLQIEDEFTSALRVQKSHEDKMNQKFGPRLVTIAQHPCKKELAHYWNGVYSFNHKCPLRFCRCSACYDIVPLGLSRIKAVRFVCNGFVFIMTYDSQSNGRLEELEHVSEFLKSAAKGLFVDQGNIYALIKLICLTNSFPSFVYSSIIDRTLMHLRPDKAVQFMAGVREYVARQRINLSDLNDVLNTLICKRIPFRSIFVYQDRTPVEFVCPNVANLPKYRVYGIQFTPETIPEDERVYSSVFLAPYQISKEDSGRIQETSLLLIDSDQSFKLNFPITIRKIVNSRVVREFSQKSYPSDYEILKDLTYSESSSLEADASYIAAKYIALTRFIDIHDLPADSPLPYKAQKIFMCIDLLRSTKASAERVKQALPLAINKCNLVKDQAQLMCFTDYLVTLMTSYNQWISNGQEFLNEIQCFSGLNIETGDTRTVCIAI